LFILSLPGCGDWGRDDNPPQPGRDKMNKMNLWPPELSRIITEEEGK
jgi:hypothetical protein